MKRNCIPGIPGAALTVLLFAGAGVRRCLGAGRGGDIVPVPVARRALGGAGSGSAPRPGHRCSWAELMQRAPPRWNGPWTS
jgi:hypothetical protein